MIRKTLKSIWEFIKSFEPPCLTPIALPPPVPPPPILTAPKDETMPFIRIKPGEVFAKNAEALEYAEKIQELINKMLPPERLEKMVGLYWTDLMVNGVTRPMEEYLKETENN